MRPFGILLVFLYPFALTQAQNAEIPTNSDSPVSAVSLSSDLSELKRLEVGRLKSMAEAGAIPRSRLNQAQAELADAEDNMILRRSLYGSVRVEEFTKEQADEMVKAAQRLVDRQTERYARTKELVDQGVIARVTLTSMSEDLEFRKKALDLALFRSKLIDELAEYARVEEAAESPDDGVVFRSGRIIERFDGAGKFGTLDYAKLSSAFQQQFLRPLPVSALGETATHRSLGFDHRGRVDVALNPDQREGVWLRSYLHKLKIPYFAFRAAVPGKATAPHIHLGPPSQRLRVAD